MRNPVAPTVAIELDKERHLCLDFNAIAVIEKLTGRNLLKKGGFNDLSATELRAFLYACMVSEDTSLTVEKVGAMIHMGNIQYVTEKFSELLQLTNGKGEGETDTERPTKTV